MLFSLGRIVLALYPRRLLAEDAMVDEAGSGLTLSYHAKSEVEVDAELAGVEKLRATIVKGLKRHSGVDTSGYFKAPFVT